MFGGAKFSSNLSVIGEFGGLLGLKKKKNKKPQQQQHILYLLTINNNG